MDMSEECLLESIARGDRRAFEDLYRSYYRRLTSFLARRLPPSHSADEIINDTLLIVWKHAGEFRNQSQVSTWIFGIAHRVALKSLRGHKRSLIASEEPFTDPYRELEQQEWLAQGLRQLPDNQRLSLLLTYQLGHSIEQVASMTECSAGTVKSRMFHARVKLRRFLTALR
jgi:RNA polymerase sigma-70 factor (ECF subfamily)